MAKAKEAHSDDEATRLGNAIVYFAKNKVGRSESTKSFFRWIDAQRALIAKAEGTYKGAEERSREDDPDGAESRISRRFPKHVPLNYFDPDYFNSLPVNLRSRYRKSGIALPLSRHWDKTDFQTMPDDEFMEKYGHEVKALYVLPTKEQLKGMKRNVKESSSESSSPSSSDDSDDEEMDV